MCSVYNFILSPPAPNAMADLLFLSFFFSYCLYCDDQAPSGLREKLNFKIKKGTLRVVKILDVAVTEASFLHP